MLILYGKFFSKKITILTIAMLTLSICVSCKGQAEQKESSQTKSIAKTEIIGQDESTVLNQYKDSKKDGLWRTHYQNGLLKSEGNYTAGLKEGLHREWGETGILLLEGFYIHGKANGLMKWFHDGGYLAGEGNMVDDVRVGPWKICDIEENGFCIDAYFKNGKRDGIWKIYHEHTKDKLWKEQTFNDDKLVSEKCWNKHGSWIECK